MITSPLTPEGMARSFEIIPITFCNILPQPRKTFVEDRLEKLGKGIEHDGLIHPVTTALYSPKKIKDFVAYVNYLWESDIAVTDLKQVPNDPEKLSEERGEEFCDRFGGRWFVLLAGERRTRSVRDYTDLKIIESFVFHDPPPEYALRLQINENSHQQVPPEEQAEAYKRLHRLLVVVESRNITLKDFASLVCRDPGTVRSALRYADMSDVFKDMVEAGLLSYGHVLELHRLKEAGFSQSKLRTYAGLAATGWDDTSNAGLTVAEFREVVSVQLDNKKSQQQGLFSHDTAEADKRNRKVAAKKWLYLANAAEKFFQELIDLLDSGLLGEGDFEYSFGSPRRRLRGILEAIEVIVDRADDRGFSQASIDQLKGRIRRIREKFSHSTNGKPQG